MFHRSIVQIRSGRPHRVLWRHRAATELLEPANQIPGDGLYQARCCRIIHDSGKLWREIFVSIYIYILPKSIYLYILPLIYFGIYSHIYIFIYVSYLCKRMNLMNFQKGLQVKWITFSTWRHQADSSFEKYWSESYLSPGQIRLTDVLTKSKGNKRETRLMQIHISPSGISKSVSEVLCTLCLWIILVWRRLDGIFLLYWSWKVVASCAFPNTI